SPAAQVCGYFHHLDIGSNPTAPSYPTSEAPVDRGSRRQPTGTRERLLSRQANTSRRAPQLNTGTDTRNATTRLLDGLRVVAFRPRTRCKVSTPPRVKTYRPGGEHV